MLIANGLYGEASTMTHFQSTIGSGLAITLMVAVVCVTVCPPEHLHRAGIEGRTDALIHAHAPQAPRSVASGSLLTHAVLGASHGDHALAVFFSGDFIGESRAAAQPAVAGCVVLLAQKLARGRLERPRSDVLAHGPPRRPFLTRGPPTLG